MSAFYDLLARGYGYCIVAEIQGIPYLFSETAPLRVDAEEAPSLPSGYRGCCPALYFGESVEATQEIDREVGFARGDALDLTLTWSALEDHDLTTGLFRRSSKRVRLKSNASHTATSLDVNDTTGWTASDDIYLGREVLNIASVVDGDTLTVTRGACSPVAYSYRADSPTNYSWLSDRPELFRGRFVTLYRHILTPEGRMLDSTWTTGTYCETFWRGYLDSHPQPDTIGMVLRALPLVRIAGEDLGYEAEAKGIAPDPEDPFALGAYPIVMTDDSTLRFEGSYTGSSSGDIDITIGPNLGAPTVTTIEGWLQLMTSRLDTALSAFPWYPTATARMSLLGFAQYRRFSTGNIGVIIPFDSGYDVKLSLNIPDVPALYWVSPGHRFFADGVGNTIGLLGEWPLVQVRHPIGAWLPVVQTEGEGYLDLTLPEQGVGLVEVDGVKELIRWDDKEDIPSAWQGGGALLRIAERGVAGTPMVDLTGAELKIVTGADGTPSSCILQMLQSSGTGAFGAYDTLGVGQGYGVPDAYIDVASFLRSADLTDSVIPAYSDGRSTLEELMGGWLALHGRCVVERRNDAGLYRLTLVQTEPLALAGRSSELSLTPADVELSGVGRPEVIDAPNEVSVARSGVASDSPDVIVQDVVAIQQSMPRRADYSAPGMSERVAVDLATLRLAVGQGQSLIAIGVAPWLDLQVGDLVSLDLAHPGSYDWATGTRRPVHVPGRVVGTSANLWSGRKTITVLLAGMAPEGLYLCPTASVVSATSTAIEIDQDLTSLWGPEAATISVTVYTPGEELTEKAEVECEITGPYELTRTSGTWAAWVGAGTRVTFASLGGGNYPSVEPAYLFQSATRQWST